LKQINSQSMEMYFNGENCTNNWWKQRHWTGSYSSFCGTPYDNYPREKVAESLKVNIEAPVTLIKEVSKSMVNKLFLGNRNKKWVSIFPYRNPFFYYVVAE
jgi:hypothetical protein